MPTDIGGGGPNPPHGEDFFNRIVNVHWPKKGVPLAVFVVFLAGSLTGDGSYHDNKTKDQLWTKIDGLPFTNPPRENGAINASAYGLVGSTVQKPDTGQPIFLLGGSRFHEELYGTSDEGIIMASSDGVNWQKVHSFVGIPYQDELVVDPNPHHEGQTSHASIHSILWDGVEFWAGGYVIDQVNRGSSEGQHETKSDVLFHSSDGFNWSEVGRNSVSWLTHDVAPDLPKQGLLAAHCVSIFIDANGNNVPSGVWGEDKAKKIRIGPIQPPTVDYTGNDDRSYLFVMPIGTSGTVQIVSEVEGRTTAETGIAGIMGVAFAGGIWWAVGSTIASDTAGNGSAAGAYSLDNGKTWTAADLDFGAVAVTVCGGHPIAQS